MLLVICVVLEQLTSSENRWSFTRRCSVHVRDDNCRLEDVKQADQASKHCVYGYIRNTQQTELPKDNVYYTIPNW